MEAKILAARWSSHVRSPENTAVWIMTPNPAMNVGCLESLMIELKPIQTEDPQFVELASQVLNGLIRLHSPQEVYAIQIDHWFDHKWQHFSGKTIGALGVWRSTLTVPPFDPGRVVSQSHFRVKDSSTATYEAEEVKPLHLDQWSGHNLHRFTSTLVPQVCSSGTAARLKKWIGRASWFIQSKERKQFRGMPRSRSGIVGS